MQTDDTEAVKEVVLIIVVMEEGRRRIEFI